MRSRRIYLSGKNGKGKYALVDEEDFPKLSKYKWYLYHTGYAYSRPKPDLPSWSMHRVVMGSPEGKVVDHLSHDTLDNRKSNLRVCTQMENQQNRNNRGHFSERFRKRGEKIFGPYYVGAITVNGKRHSIESRNRMKVEVWLDKQLKDVYI